MRRIFPLAVVLAFYPFLGGCTPGAPEVVPGQPSPVGVADDDEAPLAPAAQHIITVQFDAQGVLGVDQDEVLVRTTAKLRNPVVRWVSGSNLGECSGMPCTWMVGFAGPTPFRKDQRIITNDILGKAQGHAQALIERGVGGTEGEYKYWVFLARPDGTWISEDPKLRIIHDPGSLGDTIP